MTTRLFLNIGVFASVIFKILANHAVNEHIVQLQILFDSFIVRIWQPQEGYIIKQIPDTDARVMKRDGRVTGTVSCDPCAGQVVVLEGS
jgi:hypothetical protein